MDAIAKYPDWDNQRVREAVLRDLEWVKAVFGFAFPKLEERVKSMGTGELAEMACLTSSFVSMLNFEVRRAEKIFDDREDMRRARRIKKKLGAILKTVP